MRSIVVALVMGACSAENEVSVKLAWQQTLPPEFSNPNDDATQEFPPGIGIVGGVLNHPVYEIRQRATARVDWLSIDYVFNPSFDVEDPEIRSQIRFRAKVNRIRDPVSICIRVATVATFLHQHHDRRGFPDEINAEWIA